MDKTHGPQRFDQTETAPIKVPECLVAFEQQIHLDKRIFIGTRQEHPEILDWRADSHIVKIDQIERLARTIDKIARMTITMDPDEFAVGKQRLNLGNNSAGDLRIRPHQILRDQPTFLNEIHLGNCRHRRMHPSSILRCLSCPHHMRAPEQMPDSQPLVIIEFIDTSPSFFWKNGKIHVFILPDGPTCFHRQRRNNRNFFSR